MGNFPILHTDRLTLNRLELSDVNLVTKYCSNPVISEYLVHIPEPYVKKDAITWVENSWQTFEKGYEYVFAIRNKKTGIIIGSIGLMINHPSQKANMRYWIGEKHWSNGYMTEALKAVIQFGFNQLELNKMYASHFISNLASKCVMLKAGMQLEASLKMEHYRRGQFHDAHRYYILKEQFLSVKV